MVQVVRTSGDASCCVHRRSVVLTMTNTLAVAAHLVMLIHALVLLRYLHLRPLLSYLFQGNIALWTAPEITGLQMVQVGL